MAEKLEISKERYDELKKKELEESNLDVYEEVDNQEDADDIISSMNFVDEDVLINQDSDDIAYSYDPNASYVYKTQDNSLYIDKTAPLAKTISTSQGTGVSVNCSDIVNNFNKNLKVSKYFTLGDLTAGDFGRIIDKTVNGKNYTKYQIACNMKALSINILDKIKDRFPDMEINCTIRNWGTISEHETGQAADIRFTKTKKKNYYDIVLWIYQNLPFNQLFLEYRPSQNPRGGWIHVSYAQQGNQILGAQRYWASLYNDKGEAPGSKKSFTNILANSDWV